MKIFPILLLSTFLWVSCAEGSVSESLNLSPPQTLSHTPSDLGTAQILPVTAKAIIGDQVIELEVTQTPQEQALGLMYRTFLPDNRGMLFSFNPPRAVQFWMKNCKIPLDMIFLREGIVQAIEANVPPCLETPCPSYGPNIAVDQVIEVRGGLAAELGLDVGDSVEVQPLEPDSL